MGGRKIYHLIREDLDMLNIKMGRDALFDLLAQENMLVQKRKRKYITTNSNHWYRKYPNLIRDLVPDRPDQLWVSDITYVKTKEEVLFLFLLTDAYSKKVLGYRLAKNMDSIHAVNSLQDAIKNTCKPISGLIHHSDRGLQYGCNEYIKLLNSNNIMISMTENSDPLENAIAERINGIIKDEYLSQEINKTKYLTALQVDRAIEKYNNLRPHLSCNMLTPEEAHKATGILKRRWKNYYRKTVKLEV
jgi:transposase InsO family protein